MQNRSAFVRNLLEWYNIHKRDLPWRDTKDAYKIWLSEVILQQTRVKQGLPYFNRFMETYPDVHELANADEQAVLRLWQGLGYYSRAKNLHACAKNIVSERGGQFPNSYSELLKLKGIGKYTAAAIASFAFDEKVAVVDGNVFRVLSRVFGIAEDIGSTVGQKKFHKIANEIIPDSKGAEYNQAIMEFGALHCTPALPLCDVCSMRKFCFAYQQQMQGELPVKSKKVKVKNRFFSYFVFSHNDYFLMNERSRKDIWNGLYDFHLLETSNSEVHEDITSINSLAKISREDMVLRADSEVYKHVLTHQRLYVRFFHLEVPDQESFRKIMIDNKLRRFTLDEVKTLPKPILIENYLSKNFF